MSLHIGLSLSGCIKDILEGKEAPDYIVAGTRFRTPEEAYGTTIGDGYGLTYWDRWPKEEVLNCLHKYWDLIVQPRLMGGPFVSFGLNVSQGRYIECSDWANFWIRAENQSVKANPYHKRMFTPHLMMQWVPAMGPNLSEPE
jgi:hypothetical protein